MPNSHSRKAIVIQGSSRKDGNTSKVCNLLTHHEAIDQLYLMDYDIGHFDYRFQNEHDDFKPLITTLIEYPVWIFATPVYWYTMSGRTKVFLDRISDFLINDKPTARLLRGKSLGLVSCGSEAKLNKGFTIPFQLSAEYLGMDYLGDIHAWVENDRIPEYIKVEIADFVKKISAILAA